ncbi:MAG: hypothetical protein Q9196_007086 [Gyalolechia fulgens]
MTAPEQPSKEDKDELEALDALEKEASEFNKDAEIDRILKAFKLDAYANPIPPFLLVPRVLPQN